jgi:prophage regulatory protein
MSTTWIRYHGENGVQERYHFSRVHIDRLEKQGLFPKHVKLGVNTIAWAKDELDEHDRQLLEARAAS